MTLDVVDQVWDAMYERVGEDLRGVTGYEGLEFETRFREDVRAEYDTRGEAEFVDRLVVDQISEREIERKIGVGDLHASIRLFDECWLICWFHPSDWKAGVVVSIQRDGPKATFDDVETCLDYLETEIEPQMDSRYT